MRTAATQLEDPFVHPALFYRDDAEYLAGTVGFITEGLEAGEPVAVSVPGAKLRLLRAELGDAGGRVQFFDMTEVGRNPGRIIPGVLRAFADKHPGRRVRIIGEPIWPARTDTEYPACVQHEALINHAFTGREVSILCPYDTAGLSEQILRDAVATHPILIDAGGQRPSDGYAPDHIVDSYNLPLAVPPATAQQMTVQPGSLRTLRWLTAECGHRIGFPPDRLDDLLMAVTELASNSIEHGGGTGTMHLWTDGPELVCQVSNRGHITDPLVGRTPREPHRTSGRGLLMVNHVADLVRLHTGPDGTTIEIRFVLHSS